MIFSSCFSLIELVLPFPSSFLYQDRFVWRSRSRRWQYIISFVSKSLLINLFILVKPTIISLWDIIISYVTRDHFQLWTSVVFFFNLELSSLFIRYRHLSWISLNLWTKSWNSIALSAASLSFIFLVKKHGAFRELPQSRLRLPGRLRLYVTHFWHPLGLPLRFSLL